MFYFQLKAEELHFDNELDLDLYVKLFGTDAVFLSLGDDKGFDYNRVLDNILQAVHGGIGKAQHASVSYEQIIIKMIEKKTKKKTLS